MEKAKILNLIKISTKLFIKNVITRRSVRSISVNGNVRSRRTESVRRRTSASG